MRTSIKFLTVFTLGAMFGFYFGWVNVVDAYENLPPPEESNFMEWLNFFIDNPTKINILNDSNIVGDFVWDYDINEFSEYPDMDCSYNNRRFRSFSVTGESILTSSGGHAYNCEWNNYKWDFSYDTQPLLIQFLDTEAWRFGIYRLNCDGFSGDCSHYIVFYETDSGEILFLDDNLEPPSTLPVYEYPTLPEHSFASSITDITMSGTSTIFKNVQYVLFENEVDTNWSHRNPDRLHMKADCLNCAFDVQVNSFFSIDSADTGVQYATTTRKYHHDGDYEGLITFYSSTSSGSIFPGTGLKVFFTVQDGEVLPGFEVQREASALSSWEERLIDASEAGCTLTRLDRCIVLAVQALFFPREGYFQGWDIVITNLQTAFPFKYLYEIYTLFTSATVGESQTYTIGVPFNTGEGGTTTLTLLNTEEHIVNNQFLPDGFFNIIRTLFGFMIYLGLLLYIFKRVKGFITKLA